MQYTRKLVMAVAVGFALAAAQAGAGSGDKTTLMLGGKFCEHYLGDVETALKKVPGVKSVDLKSMKGHAIVDSEAGKVKPGQLTEAVNKVKGDGWHCTAEAMK
jgi:copper chaperone CopZ